MISRIKRFYRGNLQESKILNLANFYRKNIIPYVGGFRGFTRPFIILSQIGGELITRKQENHYEIQITETESRNIINKNLVKKYVEKEYELSLEIINNIDQDTVFYDIGGYHGYHTLLGSLGKKAYAFEPDPNNLDELRHNIELNSDQDIEIVEKPLWGEIKEIEIDTGHGGESSVGNGNLKIKSTTLDNFVIEEDNLPPDMIKIDVEGAEYQVLDGAREVLKKHHPRLIIEVHKGERLRKLGGSLEEIREILRENQYNFREEKRSDEIHIYTEPGELTSLEK